MEIKLRIHELDEVVESKKLIPHAGLVAEKVTFHTIHKVLEAPKSDGVVLQDSIDRSKEIGHALDVAKVAIVFVIGEEHVFHLLKMDICSDVCKW